MFTLACAGGWLSESFEDKFFAAAKLGFRAVEILSWNTANLDKARRAIDTTGVALSAILFQSRDTDKQAFLSNSHGIVHEDALSPFLDAIRETMNAAKTLGCSNIVVTTGNDRPGVHREIQRANIVRALREAGKIAEDSGVSLVLEPLNTLVNHHGYFLNTTAESVDILREVGSPAVRLLYDVYHQQITEGNLIANIRNHIEWIYHIHLGDVPGRKEPGTGEIHYKNVLKAIADTGYDKFVALECGLTEDAAEASRKMFALLP